MPQTAAATETSIDNNTLNPNQTSAPTVVHVTLQFDGVTFVPDTLYDMLNGTYGTVKNEKDVPSRGTYIFRISA